jgi:methyl-accepting chemotaxis protein
MTDLLKSLQSVTTLMNNLLSDIKEHAASLALVKAKLESLTENVEALSHVVRDGNGKGSMMTRLALAEKSLEDIEEEFHELKGEISASVRDIKRCVENEKNVVKKDELEEKKYKREKTIARFQIIGALLAGFLALGLQLMQIIWK